MAGSEQKQRLALLINSLRQELANYGLWTKFSLLPVLFVGWFMAYKLRMVYTEEHWYQFDDREH